MPKTERPTKVASKRFKKTGTGKVVAPACVRSAHPQRPRRVNVKNKLHTSVVADDSDQAKLQRMIPY